MGKAIFQTEIIELGEQVDAFFEEGMFVLFGDNVPDTLKDFCHFIDQNPHRTAAFSRICQPLPKKRKSPIFLKCITV